MDFDGAFSFSDLSIKEWMSLISKMREWESMTWGELLGRRNHAIDVDSLSNKAKRRLIELNLDDIDELVSLHIDGIKRLFGIRSNNIFYVLWWDPNHEVCPSVKKHT